jgi:hypothetical protein
VDRVHGSGWREPVAVAQRVIGSGLMSRLGHVRYVLGVDPVFIGLHRYGTTVDGRSYRNTAHCVYPCHIEGPADRRTTTVAVPSVLSGWGLVRTLVHELGHALDEVVGFGHLAVPVSEYARANRYEAFAEAFTVWCWGSSPGYDQPDPWSAGLFRRLQLGD